MDMSISRPALQRAIDIKGSQEKLAEAIGYAQSSISNWLKSGVVPPRACPAIELATGVPRHETRPDIFGSNLSMPPQRRRSRVSERVAS